MNLHSLLLLFVLCWISIDARSHIAFRRRRGSGEGTATAGEIKKCYNDCIGKESKKYCVNRCKKKRSVEQEMDPNDEYNALGRAETLTGSGESFNDDSKERFQRTIGSLAKEILSNFDLMIKCYRENGGPPCDSTPIAKFYLAHDVTIIALMNVVSRQGGARAMFKDLNPNFANSIVMEMYLTTEEETYVRMHLKDGALSEFIEFPYCDYLPVDASYPRVANFCSVEALRKAISDYIDEDPPPCVLPTEKPCCPPGGSWSEWVTSGQCSDTCGSCGVARRTRTCTSEVRGYNCTGLDHDDGPCGVVPCPFPASACCNPFQVSLNGNTGLLFCGTGDTPADCDDPTPATLKSILFDILFIVDETEDESFLSEVAEKFIEKTMEIYTTSQKRARVGLITMPKEEVQEWAKQSMPVAFLSSIDSYEALDQYLMSLEDFNIPGDKDYLSQALQFANDPNKFKKKENVYRSEIDNHLIVILTAKNTTADLTEAIREIDTILSEGSYGIIAVGYSEYDPLSDWSDVKKLAGPDCSQIVESKEELMGGTVDFIHSHIWNATLKGGVYCSRRNIT